MQFPFLLKFALNWTNYDQVYWRVYASSRLNGLKRWNKGKITVFLDSGCFFLTKTRHTLSHNYRAYIRNIHCHKEHGRLVLIMVQQLTQTQSKSSHSIRVIAWMRPRESFIVRRAGLLWSQQDFEWRWSVPLLKCLTVLEFSFILFDLCLLITFFNSIMNYVPIVTFWIFTYHKIWILSIMFCFIWSYWIIYFLACLEVSWRVVC